MLNSMLNEYNQGNQSGSVLAFLQAKLAQDGLIGPTWGTYQQEKSELVRLFRDYYRGFHRMKLTIEMKRMLQITDARLDRYNVNYCEMIVDTVADRLYVDSVVTDTDDERTEQWLQDVIMGSRFDHVQIQAHEYALIDGESFILVEYSEEKQRPLLSAERAFDGAQGMIVVRDSMTQKLAVAVKIWIDNQEAQRVTIFYPDRVEKWRIDGSITLLETIDTKEIGIPVACLINQSDGVSELVNVIPLQDSLNRTLLSMVMSSELAGFPIMFAKGFSPPTALTPAMIIEASLKDGDGNQLVPTDSQEASAFASMISSLGLERIEGGSLVQFINQGDWLIKQIANVTSTPIVTLQGNDSQSGEALKQRDIRLLGKVKRAQVQYGNGYEDAFTLALRVQNKYGSYRVPDTYFYCKWKDGQLRSDGDLLMMAQFLQQAGYEREALRVLAQSTLFNYSIGEIERMMAEKRADSAMSISSAFGRGVTPFSNFLGES